MLEHLMYKGCPGENSPCPTPLRPRFAPLRLARDGVESGAVDFMARRAPRVASISSSKGWTALPGLFHVSGGDLQGRCALQGGRGTSAVQENWVSSGLIICEVAQNRSGLAEVTVGGSRGGAEVKVFAQPLVSGVQPATAPEEGGTVVVVHGEGFP